jgi:hypothetical protein
MSLSNGPWFASAPHPQTHACVITNAQGRVIAAMVPSVADAAFIALARDMAQECEELRASADLAVTRWRRSEAIRSAAVDQVMELRAAIDALIHEAINPSHDHWNEWVQRLRVAADRASAALAAREGEQVIE